jgi:hypothetical protein
LDAYYDFKKCSDELSRFVADRRLLKSLKMEGCSNLGGFALCSSSLSTLWLSGLHSLSKMVIVFLFTLVSHAVADFIISYFSFVFTSTSLLLIHTAFHRFSTAPI